MSTVPHDWTKDELDDYSFLPTTIATRDADEIEQEAASRDFKPIEPGDHELVVLGFLKPPETKWREGWLNGQRVSWQSPMVTVRFGKVGDHQSTIFDTFDLPPQDPRQLDGYLNAKKENTENSKAGFLSEKFGHFISRLGWPYPKGAPLPAEACRLGNWKGRTIHATVNLQKSNANQVDQRTGLPFPPKAQVKLFSYRPSESTIAGHPPVAPQASPGRPAAQRAAAPAPPRQPVASNGLEDL